MTASPGPLVSVVVPAYNAARYIGESLESALAQTFSAIELLVVDDHSSDETAAIVGRLARRDSRIRLFRHDSNSGPAGARNTALGAARGRYIAFLDSDDIWKPAKLERQLAFMEERAIAFSFTQYDRVDATGARLTGTVPVPAVLDYHALLRNTAIMTSSVLVDRQRTGPWVMKATYYDDFACWLEIARRGFPATALREDLMSYRVVPGSVSRKKLRSARHIWQVHRQIEKLSLPVACWCWGQYAWNAFRKHHLLWSMGYASSVGAGEQRPGTDRGSA